MFLYWPKSVSIFVEILSHKTLELRAPQGEAPVHGVGSLIRTGAFPFVDLCPWLKADGEDLAGVVDFP
jgi:hypothetical protein